MRGVGSRDIIETLPEQTLTVCSDHAGVLFQAISHPEFIPWHDNARSVDGRTSRTRLGTRGSRSFQVVSRLELIAERKLNQLLSVETRWGAPELSTGPAKRAASNTAITASEGMPVKKIHKICLEGQNVSFIQRKALNERKILVHVARTAYVTEDFRKIAEGIASLCDKTWSIRIKESRAVEEIVC